MAARQRQGQRNPYPTVDIVIEREGGIVLVERRNPPHGWALPGGFMETGETAERAAVREAAEETGLAVTLVRLLGVYSDPARDPRCHTMSVVYVAAGEGELRGGDDALRAAVFPLDALPPDIVFDHPRIIRDYVDFLRTGELPRPGRGGR